MPELGASSIPAPSSRAGMLPTASLTGWIGGPERPGAGRSPDNTQEVLVALRVGLLARRNAFRLQNNSNLHAQNALTISAPVIYYPDLAILNKTVQLIQ